AEAVAVAQTAGFEALGVAASVKLVVNALQGIPIALYLWRFAPNTKGHVATRILVRVPVFVWGFSALAIAAWLGGFSANERGSLGNLTSWAFFVALVGVGFQTRLQVLRRVGLRPLMLATLVWLGVSALVLLALI
ncbi:putative sulfate exporter family transporter, partial [Planctomycetota bacterium]|nr:putative sulfate exporter family transporter [Planctomycetota bacterium]